MQNTLTDENAKAIAVDREMTLSRVIHAPRELVYNAIADPNQVVEWWGPNGFTTTTREFDMKPGGFWRFVMHGPDGRDYENQIHFTEVVPPERIVYAHTGGSEQDNLESVSFKTIITLEDLNGKTRITWRAIFPTNAERDFVIAEYGALEGGKQNLERLAAHAEQLAGEKRTTHFSLPSDLELRIERVIRAPRELLFDAWTKPQHVPHWLIGPPGWTMKVCDIDLRVGGKWHFVSQKDDGVTMEIHGEYLEISRPDKLVHTDSWGDPWPATVNTLEFIETDGGTNMVLTMRYPSKEARDAALKSGMEHGMDQSYNHLEEYLTRLH